MMFECGRRNAECGKKKKEDRRWEFGIGNAECGKKKRQRLSISDLGFFRFGISDLGFRIETAREGNGMYRQWLIKFIV
jgi:hypothetical protein